MSTESKKSGSGEKKKAVRKVKGKLSGPKGGIKPKVVTILFALIKMSGIGITEISGKLGGNVFSRTKGGAVIRNRVVGTNPQTIAQQMVRAIFGAISSAWRSLNDEQRANWNAVAQDYPYQNRLGETKILSGKALFQKLNNNLLYAGESIIETPLAPQGVNAPIALDADDVELNVAGDDWESFDINVTLATPSDSTTLIVLEATPPLSPGVKNASARFVRISQVVAANSFGSFVSGAVYTDVFGLPAVGSQVQFRAFAVNPETGEKSALMSASSIVTQA